MFSLKEWYLRFADGQAQEISECESNSDEQEHSDHEDVKIDQ